MENKHLVIAAAMVVIANICFASVARAQTQGWVEGQGTMTKDEHGRRELTPTMAMWVQKPFGRGFGGFAFGSVTKGFGQIYAGPTYAPAKWLELGAGGGLQDNGQFRAGSYAWVGGAQGYALALGEYNRTAGWWYKGIAALKPAKPLALGGFVQRFTGVGPYVEFKLDNSVLPLTLWSSPVAYDWEAPAGSRIKAIVALRAQF